MRLAVGTSLLIITVTSVMALVAHLIAGRTLEFGVTAAMTGACNIGALAGWTSRGGCISASSGPASQDLLSSRRFC